MVDRQFVLPLKINDQKTKLDTTLAGLICHKVKHHGAVLAGTERKIHTFKCVKRPFNALPCSL
jgi:hypothetical protein